MPDPMARRAAPTGDLERAAIIDRIGRALADDPAYSDAVREFARTEFGRGHHFHVQSIRRLALNGKKALDAGCGVGNWALALAEFHDEVTALEYSKDRLKFTADLAAHVRVPLRFVRGTIESLPFPDATFDTVFCNGVVFLTDFRKALPELIRVLAPGGKLYVTGDDSAWWEYLIDVRGASASGPIEIAVNAFCNQIADLIELLPKARQDQGVSRAIAAAGALRWLLRRYSGGTRNYSNWLSRLRSAARIAWRSIPTIRRCAPGRNGGEWWSSDEINRHRIRALINACARVAQFGNRQQIRNLESLMLAMLAERGPDFGRSGAVCIEPNEQVGILKSAGLHIVGHGPEGSLQIDPHVVMPPSIHPTSWGVYEIVARRPSDIELNLSTKWFRENGRRAALRFEGETLPFGSANRIDRAIDFGAQLHAYWREAAELYDRNDVLAQLTRHATESARTPDEFVSELVSFVQDALFHHPLIQFPVGKDCDRRDALAILLSGIGRCGHAAAVVAAMARSAGYEARTTQLHKHICAEIRVDDRWLVADTDAYKGGLHPRNASGEWPTLSELRDNPHLLDAIPAIGLQLPPNGPWARGIGDCEVLGYTDAAYPWQRQPMSFLYFGGDEWYPPPPPAIEIASINGETCLVRAPQIHSDVTHIRLVVSGRSRGWKYGDIPANTFAQGHAEACDVWQGSAAALREGIELTLRPGENFLNVFAMNDRMAADRRFFVWPGDETCLKI